jgi:hypothetical protein
LSAAASLVALLVTLGAAVARPRLAPDWAVAVGTALLLVAAGVLSTDNARYAVADLGPTGRRPIKKNPASAGLSFIGETGFEPATARPPAGCATRLRHSPWCLRP